VNIIVHDSGDQTTFLIVPFQKYSAPHTTRPSFSPVASSFTFAAETNSTRGKQWGEKKSKGTKEDDRKQGCKSNCEVSWHLENLLVDG
jgi:hypothetical protein